MNDQTPERIAELEIRFMQQEQLLETLNEQLYLQQCQDPSDHRLYPYGKLTLARQVLNSLLTGSELTS